MGPGESDMAPVTGSTAKRMKEPLFRPMFSWAMCDEGAAGGDPSCERRAGGWKVVEGLQATRIHPVIGVEGDNSNCAIVARSSQESCLLTTG